MEQIIKNIGTVYDHNDLINQITNQINSIIIDDYKFTLLNKGMANNREHVLLESINIKSNDKKSIFAYYRSNSEGGYWRACVWGWYGAYDKGINYVTSSFINIELQNFINQQYNSLSNIENILHNCYLKTLLNNKADELMDQIYNEDRIQQDLIIDVISDCKAGECFRSDFDIKKYINGLSDKWAYEKELKGLLQQIDTEQSLNEIIKKMYENISKFMEDYFTCDLDTISYIGKYIFKYTSDIQISNEFYKVNIENRKHQTKYTLFYSKYEYENKKRPKFNGTYYCIVNMVPTDSQITKYGLYDKIVSAGVYIYKIIEYKQQCNIDDGDRHIESPSGGDACYTFIGDFITNLWPLNIIQLSENKK